MLGTLDGELVDLRIEGLMAPSHSTEQTIVGHLRFGWALPQAGSRVRSCRGSIFGAPPHR